MEFIGAGLISLISRACVSHQCVCSDPQVSHTEVLPHVKKYHMQIKTPAFMHFFLNLIDSNMSSHRYLTWFLTLLNRSSCAWVQPPPHAHILVADRKQEILLPLKITIVGLKISPTRRRVFYLFIYLLVGLLKGVLSAIVSNMS